MLKREQCDHTKHDSSFSHWKILIGPYDWGNCQNLPQNSSPGVYELGVGSSASDLGREIYKLATDPHRVLAVYIGKSDNVKKILRSYGRDGAHLGDNCSSGSLFNEIFFRAFPIFYRWAAMQTDGEACRVKSQMLETFDYAWNQVDNGKRRSNDILQMLNIISSNKLPMTADKSDEVEKNSSFVDVSITKIDVGTSEVALEVEVNHQLADDKSNEAENNSRFVDESITKNDVGTSEVALEAEVDHQLAEASPLKKKGRSDKGEANKKKDGTVCTKPPVEKRFSCHEHKGMRINLFRAKAIRRSKFESEILAESFVDESITKNDVGTSEDVVLEAKVDHQLAEAFPLKKKGKNDKGEANKKMVECFLEVKTDRSLWNKNFDRAGFVKDHFNLYEDFEATRKSNHSNMFHDASVSCLRSVVLLEVMEEEFQAVKSNADRLKQENEELKLRVKTLEDQLKESSNSSKTTKDVKKKDEEDKRDIEAKCVELNNNYGVIKGEVEKITELKDGVENAKKRWLGIWKRGRLRSHVVIPRS